MRFTWEFILVYSRDRLKLGLKMAFLQLQAAMQAPVRVIYTVILNFSVIFASNKVIFVMYDKN